ncbi:MAG: hypothetical protein ACI88H_000133 [Cocleimonas sp.]|jgi:hypothetical protein
MADPFEKALDDMLAMPHIGKDATFFPDVGASFPIRVIYGKDSNLMAMGDFETQDYEHQFLCRAKDIPTGQRQAEIEFNGRHYSIVKDKIKEPAAILFGE